MQDITAPGLSDAAAAELANSEDNAEDEEFEFDNKAVKFCKDDIYASYLKKSFSTKQKQQLANEQQKKNRKQDAARFYASQMIDGREAAYFGALPVANNPDVERWIHHYQTSGREQFIKWLVRSDATRNIVVPIIQKEGLPKELFFLAMIESGFSNSASSHAQATGTWQFMKSTARSYGLLVNHWVDERRDPIKSTVAASRYLRDLYEQFHDWVLAIAAYNAGPGKIRKAIASSSTRDFWTIAKTAHLSRETREYVPKMMAALIISSNPEQYGFNVVKIDTASVTPSGTVKLERAASLKEISEKLDVSVKQLKTWNPELLRDIVPPPSSDKKMAPYVLRLPERLVSKMEDVKKDLTQLEIHDIKMHTVRVGDTLNRLAKQYQVHIKEILSVNPQLDPSRLKIGKEIAIPVPAVTIKGKEKEEA